MANDKKRHGRRGFKGFMSVVVVVVGLAVAGDGGIGAPWVITIHLQPSPSISERTIGSSATTPAELN